MISKTPLVSHMLLEQIFVILFKTVSVFQCEAVDPADRAADKGPMSYGFATFIVPFAFSVFLLCLFLEPPSYNPMLLCRRSCFYHNSDPQLHPTALKGFSVP